MEKITRVSAPFDMRNEDPKKNYGIHGLDVIWILKGAKGAVQFMANFPVFLPHVEAEGRLQESWERFGKRIQGHDVGYHSPEPQYDGQTATVCDLFECGKCYYDGSSLRAQDWANEIFAIRGERPEKEIWRRLEKEYLSFFGEKEERE